MTSRDHHDSKIKLNKRLEKLEQINHAEEQAVSAEVAKIKRHHIEKFGRPKPITTMPLKGIVSERNEN